MAALLVGGAAAAYTDARTGLILDKITYPMIALGIVLNLIEFDLSLFYVAIAVFAISYVLYWLGKIGGGDVKLFAGIALLLPYFNGNVFIVHALLAAAILSIIFYSVYYVAKYWRKGISLQENRQGILSALVLGIITAAYFYYMISMQFMAVQIAALLYVVIAFALFFLALEKGIKRNFFLKEVKLGKLEEDEVIATDFLDKGVKEKLKLHWKGVFGKKEIDALRKIGVKMVPVYRDMPPFAPFVFLGLAIVLWAPELFGFLII